MVERLFLAVPQGCLQFVIVVFPDHTHLLFLLLSNNTYEIRYSTVCKLYNTCYTIDNRGIAILTCYPVHMKEMIFVRAI